MHHLLTFFHIIYSYLVIVIGENSGKVNKCIVYDIIIGL